MSQLIINPYVFARGFLDESWEGSFYALDWTPDATTSLGLTFTTDFRQLHMSSDGSKLWILRNSGNVHTMDLSTPYDTSTMTENATQFIDLPLSAVFEGIQVSSDGTKVFALTTASTLSITEFTLGTAFDMSTATHSGVSIPINFSPMPSTDSGFYMRADGKRFYIAGSGSIPVIQYDMETPWDITTIGGTKKYLGMTNQLSTLYHSNVDFNADGSEMYLLTMERDGVNGVNVHYVFRFMLEIPWEIQSAIVDTTVDLRKNPTVDRLTFAEINSNSEANRASMTFSPDGTNFYVLREPTSGSFSIQRHITTFGANETGGHITLMPSTAGDVSGTSTRTAYTGVKLGNRHYGTHNSTTPSIFLPAYGVGDLVIFYVDVQDATALPITWGTGPNGETITEIVAPVTMSGTYDNALCSAYFIATGSNSFAGGKLGMATLSAFNYTKSWSVQVLANSFDANKPIGATASMTRSWMNITTMSAATLYANSDDGGGLANVMFVIIGNTINPLQRFPTYVPVYPYAMGATSWLMVRRNQPVSASETVSAFDYLRVDGGQNIGGNSVSCIIRPAP